MSEKIKYVDVNGFNKSYEVVEDLNIKLSVDYSEEIWAERYRPRILEDLVLEDDKLAKIKEYVKKGDIGNILFYSINGGSGKDSIVSVLNNLIESEIKVINASMYRNVSDVKDKIMSVVSTNSMSGATKWIYLSEIGGMNKSAIDSLKAVIEENSHVRFVITTNSLDNLTEPFLTRFTMFDMNTIKKEDRKPLLVKILTRVMAILRNENVKFDKVELKDFVVANFPSYRSTLIALQDNVVDGEFRMVSENESDEILNYLKTINEENYTECVKKADTVNVANFLRYMNMHKLELIKEPSDIPDIIYELNNLQDALNKHVAFPAISLTVFAMKMITSDVKFKV